MKSSRQPAILTTRFSGGQTDYILAITAPPYELAPPRWFMSLVLFNPPAQFVQFNFPESACSMIPPGARLLPFGMDLISLFLDTLAGFFPLLPGLVSPRADTRDIAHHAIKVRNSGLV